MRFVSFRHSGVESFGLVEGATVIDAQPIAAEVGNTLRAALKLGSLRRVGQWALSGQPGIALEHIELLPVIPDPGKILCIGINYLSHVKETGREVPKWPMVFTRFADSQVAHQGSIIRPAISGQLDFEGELAVVIGKRAWRIKAANALDYVAGYSCYNDGSVRDWQRHTIQFTPGKNYPRTGGFGPWLVTADEVGDPATLELTTRLNGTVMQSGRLSDLVFSVPALIEYCSTFTELHPGDVIVTGTPGGVGAFREPPLWMKPGDVIEVEISHIGTLRNYIADEMSA